MTSFKVLGPTLILSALLATPASAWQAVSEPAAAAAADPTFSIYSNYSNYGRGYQAYGMASQVPLGDASGLRTSVRPHHRRHTAGVKRY
jgi:hypothetical protein